ncbi:MAG: serine protease [Acholeplasmataceae bacterium]|nr:serine protease [Acholeplasmataceae bacterium]
MRKIVIILLIVVAFLLSACTEPLTYEELYETYIQEIADRQATYQTYIDQYETIYTEIVRAVVQVKAHFVMTSAAGSGYLFYEDESAYYVLTNYHVVSHPTHRLKNYEVVDYQEKTHAATLVFADANYDLAMLSIAKKTQDELMVLSTWLIDAPIKSSAFILGYPDGQINALSSGQIESMISSNIVDEKDVDVHIDFKVFLIEAPVLKGSSGSVVFNENYHVVGLVYAGSFSNDNKMADAALAIPSAKIIEFLALHDFEMNGGMTP